MRRTVVLFLAAAPVALGLTAAVRTFEGVASSRAEEGVRVALQYYLDGHATGDPLVMEKAFHPEAKLFWVRDGELNQRTLTDYLAGLPGEPAPDEAHRQRKIAALDAYGTAATARVELDYPNAYIVDYMSLLKIDGEWKIVNKIFYFELKESD